MISLTHFRTFFIILQPIFPEAKKTRRNSIGSSPKAVAPISPPSSLCVIPQCSLLTSRSFSLSPLDTPFTICSPSSSNPTQLYSLCLSFLFLPQASWSGAWIDRQLFIRLSVILFRELPLILIACVGQVGVRNCIYDNPVLLLSCHMLLPPRARIKITTNCTAPIARRCWWISDRKTIQPEKKFF